MVSLLGDWNYRFPKKQKLSVRLEDMLEQSVDKKYFISQEKIEALQRQAKKKHKPTLLNTTIHTHTNTITAGYFKGGLWEQYVSCESDEHHKNTKTEEFP